MHIPRIRVRIPTVAFAVSLVLLDRSILSLLSLTAALCHELGHIAAMLALGAEVREIELTVFGAEIRTPHAALGTVASVVVFSAGAAANLICAAIVFLLPRASFEANFFAAASFSLAAINLLPIRTLDGGCILETILIRVLPRRMSAVVDVTSATVLAVLWLAAVYLLIVCGGNLSLMLFCMYLFATLFLY